MIRFDEVNESEHSKSKLRFAAADIKLLRVSLVAESGSMSDELGSDWIGAQPNQNLSPASAGRALKMLSWSFATRVKERYHKLLLRFPPDQFSQKHIDWRPAEELLGSPTNRLNWYWQSGQVPGVEIADDLSDESKQWLAQWWQHTPRFGQMTCCLFSLVASKTSSPVRAGQDVDHRVASRSRIGSQ